MLLQEGMPVSGVGGSTGTAQPVAYKAPLVTRASMPCEDTQVVENILIVALCLRFCQFVGNCT